MTRDQMSTDEEQDHILHPYLDMWVMPPGSRIEVWNGSEWIDVGEWPPKLMDSDELQSALDKAVA